MPDMPQYQRALLAAIYQLRDTMRGEDSKTHDEYLQEAQYVLESSYRNYVHPANLDNITTGQGSDNPDQGPG